VANDVQTGGGGRATGKKRRHEYLAGEETRAEKPRRGGKRGDRALGTVPGRNFTEVDLSDPPF